MQHDQRINRCLTCRFAQWQKTKTGALHPSGDGRCSYEVKMPDLPGAYSWFGISKEPSLNGGYITRRKLGSVMGDRIHNCPTYENTAEHANMPTALNGRR